jgi:hypothetical protein
MSHQKPDDPAVDEARRDFLRKSVYAAYATPVITLLLVSEASALKSPNSSPGACRQAKPPGEWIGSGRDGCCDQRPNDGCPPPDG